MQTNNPYLLQTQELFLQMYHHPFFQYALSFILFLVAFFLGRLFHVSKIQHLLDMVNDSDNAKKLLSEKLTSTNLGIKSLTQKRNKLRALTVILILINGVQIYLTKTIEPYLFVGSLSLCIFIWMFWHIRMRYLSWSQNKIEEQLRAASKMAEIQVKEILELLGAQIKTAIQKMMETELEIQWAKQTKQQCKLLSCTNEKNAYNNLYDLYDEIINQIKKINLCNICLNRQNVNTHSLQLNELETFNKNCFKALQEGKLNLERKKEIVNRLLGQWQRLSENMNFICKRGCCIKQRNLIEGAKIKYHERLKQLKAQLN